jgi:hypothetical protein
VPVSKTELKNKKELAYEILKLVGKDPDEWLFNQYEGLIQDNFTLLLEALKHKQVICQTSESKELEILSPPTTKKNNTKEIQ